MFYSVYSYVMHNAAQTMVIRRLGHWFFLEVTFPIALHTDLELTEKGKIKNSEVVCCDLLLYFFAINIYVNVNWWNFSLLKSSHFWEL